MNTNEHEQLRFELAAKDRKEHKNLDSDNLRSLAAISFDFGHDQYSEEEV